jgi:tRNA dimethylallyltransferase
VGKTDLSIALAKAIGAEIISVDSRLLYRGMDVGTAKPNRNQLEQIRHHLVDVADPSENWSLSQYLDAVREAIDQIHASGKVPLLVGGTGQYFAALIEGWQPPPKAEDPDYREQLRQIAEEEGREVLHERLAEVDPKAAERIDARNVRRVIRALEIFHVTGVPASDQREKTPPDYSFLILGLKRDREELYQRIDERIESMIASGWIDEVNALLQEGLGLESPALSAIGYRQVAGFLLGEHDLATAIEQTQRLTRQFVRRQDNWFRRFEPDVHWFDAAEDAQDQIIALTKNWLTRD